MFTPRQGGFWTFSMDNTYFSVILFKQRATPLISTSAFSVNLNLGSDRTVKGGKSIESAGELSSKMVIRVIPHSGCETKGEVS